jgi:hypothetical protein
LEAGKRAKNTKNMASFEKKYLKAKRACKLWIVIWAVTVIVFVSIINKLILK